MRRTIWTDFDGRNSFRMNFISSPRTVRRGVVGRISWVFYYGYSEPWKLELKIWQLKRLQFTTDDPQSASAALALAEVDLREDGSLNWKWKILLKIRRIRRWSVSQMNSSLRTGSSSVELMASLSMYLTVSTWLKACARTFGLSVVAPDCPSSRLWSGLSSWHLFLHWSDYTLWLLLLVYVRHCLPALKFHLRNRTV